MYYVGGRGNAAIAARPDCAGMGPTSTTPWAEASMQWWAARVPKEKLVMGLPAYSNDYSALPGWGGGNGSQAGVGPPTSAEPMCNASKSGGGNASGGCSNVEAIWDFFSQIYTCVKPAIQLQTYWIDYMLSVLAEIRGMAMTLATWALVAIGVAATWLSQVHVHGRAGSP